MLGSYLLNSTIDLTTVKATINDMIKREVNAPGNVLKVSSPLYVRLIY